MKRILSFDIKETYHLGEGSACSRKTYANTHELSISPPKDFLKNDEFFGPEIYQEVRDTDTQKGNLTYPP